MNKPLFNTAQLLNVEDPLPTNSAGKGKAKAAKKYISLPLNEAVSFYVISEKAIMMMGISAGDLLIGKVLKPASKKKKQSIYHCQHCGYLTEQKDQGATHVRSIHLGHCLQCQLCSYHTYHSVDFKPHLERHHLVDKNSWYEPLPDLGHLVAIEVNADELVVGVKKEESDNDSDVSNLEAEPKKLQTSLSNICLNQ